MTTAPTASVANQTADAPDLLTQRFRTLAITPFEQPDLRLARALARLDVATAIDLGRDPLAAAATLAALAATALRGCGLRLADTLTPPDVPLPEAIAFLVIDGDPSRLPPRWRQRPWLAQVCSVEEAEQSLDAGAAGLISKGQESGGRSGDESSFVLLQRMLACVEQRAARSGGTAAPVWCQGGIGLHTAAAAFAGGASGVVIDNLLAPYADCELPAAIKTRVLALDGSEPQLIAGHQVLAPADTAPGVPRSVDDEPVAMIHAALVQGRLLAIGQDAALARLALAECANLEALVQTLRMRISAQLRQAQALRLLDEDSPWAVAHGTRYPIAQGPMTRVSDTAAFATAVADAGGLPFLALSLMREADCRSLMQATREQIGAQPWGVGVLGFAAPEVLEPQLALVRELRPSVLLLAGGRPSQARPFVELGIPTYLHVPSPGLLDLFLKDGATHFVFEGRECGGHVGPRYSFVLWEQALARLAQVEDAETLHLLFAGGIHDARSAAMVAALAAPLAARGAKIGVLMGTAYIATRQAVSCGAVQEHFQTKALTGARTTLVETAPGHAIRCLPSGFMTLFAREQARLRQERVDTKTAWAALEALTIGRLRIATKGLDRVGETLAAVPAARQDAEGMYMIGQVIALQREVIDIAQLHERVSAGATHRLAALKPPALQAAAHASPVAVVGMACLYAGSPDLETFWANILEGRDLVTEVPAERWNVAMYYRAEGGADKSVSKWGGFIPETAFDPLQYGIPPQSLAAIEPVQLLSLEIARRALQDADYVARDFDREKTSVIFGAEAGMDLGNQYTFRNLYPQYCGDLPQALAEALPSLTEDSFPGMLVNVISGRIANRLGLGGVNYAVTSACASSLTAVDLAVKELRSGSSDMVLAGGADFHNGIADFLMFSSVGALSSRGRCRSFDNDADGIALGEGVGVVVLKRLEDAERDGDRIYAVIDSTAGSSDGKGLGLTAPRREGQRRALERSYWQAGVLPADVGLVEAHGTGTVVGDRTELRTLTEVYVAGGAVPGQTGLGSVKSQIGHSKCAAGIAGLIKVAKALHHGVLPPTAQITTPNAGYRPADSPFQLNREASPWRPSGNVPRAAVSAFGFGGTNFHTLLSAYPAHRSAAGAALLPAELFALRGATPAAALTLAQHLTEYLEQAEIPPALRDLAQACWQGGNGPVQMAFSARTLDELRTRLTAIGNDHADPAIQRRGADAAGTVACLFPGQGSQYPGMLRELFVYFPALLARPGASRYLPLIYPASAYDDVTKARDRQRLTDTRNTQPALGLVELAAFEWLASLGLHPDMTAGHSYGELVALAAAGVCDAATLLTLSETRAMAIRADLGADSGAMAAVRLDAVSLGPLLAGFPNVVMANQNSPIQTVISGPTADLQAACAFLGQQAVGYKLIDTDCAFHSPLMAPAERRYAAALADQVLTAPRCPVYSNITAAPHADDAESIRARLAQHIVSPVRFVEQIERMYVDGARLFLEIGPRRVLSGLVGRILKDRPHQTLALDAEGDGLPGIFALLAQLAVRLPAFDAAPLFAGRCQPLDLQTPPRRAATTWWISGGHARLAQGRLPAHAARPLTQTIQPAVATAPAPTTADAGEQALMGYLNNMRELVNAQRDVLLGYFGAPQERRAVPPTPLAAAAAISDDVTPPTLTTEPAPTPVTTDSRSLLLQLVSERTGYPIEMLDVDLDLEADLSIDSIKRLEIVSELAQRLNLRSRLGSGADALLERLSAQKTLRQVVECLDVALPTASVPAAAASTADAASPQRVADVLLDVVSHCTGYPPEALDADLDLEADLSIDSIKRIEVIGQLAERLQIQPREQRDAMQEALSGLKTLRAMSEWLEQRATPAVESAIAGAPVSVTLPTLPLKRYLLRVQALPAAVAGHIALDGLLFVITDDGLGLAPRVAQRLQRHGATVRIVAFPDRVAFGDGIDHVDGLIHLGSLNPAGRVRDVKRLFAMMQEALAYKLRHLLVASALGGDFGHAGHTGSGGGLAGLVKTVAKECPELRAHWVDFDLGETLDGIAECIERELLADPAPVEIAYKGGRRYTRGLVPMALPMQAESALPLDADSVVLLTGGARGITALLAVALAQRYRCHLELVGRSPLPTRDEDAATRTISDPRALRQALLTQTPGVRPAEIEQRTRRLLADREVRDTVQRIQAAGGSLRYTALDVRDDLAFQQFVDDIYARRGRLDGVIHGAGVVEDKLLRDKTEESFDRVFDTKVQSALVLHERVRDDVKFVVFFSSVASAFGNRGQIDYASANDVLDTLAHRWQTRIAGRVLSVNWGPWADTGMVSDALRGEYARKGIGLIPREQGVAALLRELGAAGHDTQVVLMCGSPESFGAPRADA